MNSNGHLKLRLVMPITLLALLLSQTHVAFAAHRSTGERLPLVMYSFAFANDASVTEKVRYQCRFEEILNNAVKTQSIRRRANIDFASTMSEFESAQRQLIVSVEDVNAHEWQVMHSRPSSIVTFSGQIVIDGKTVKRFRKQIRSGMAFGACDRVEKIANSAGAFIAEWVARQSY